MSKIINSNQKMLATDEECKERRSYLISNGIVTPFNKSTINNNRKVVKKSIKNLRKDLIERGFIQPVERKKDGSISYCELPSRIYVSFSSDEGEYRSKPITTDDEYFRRCQIYFRIMQEVLFSRRDLKLNLVMKNDSDPDWFF